LIGHFVRGDSGHLRLEAPVIIVSGGMLFVYASVCFILPNDITATLTGGGSGREGFSRNIYCKGTDGSNHSSWRLVQLDGYSQRGR